MSEIKVFFDREDVKNKFKEMLGNRSTSFITSVLQIISQNKDLSKAEPLSIYQAAATAAALDLPLNQNLGFAYIIPYKQKDGTYLAQFQIGYKGFIQLAQRSGQFKNIYSSAIYEGQIIDSNPLDGYKFDFTKRKSDVVIGYAAKFSLINGFEAVLFMSIEQLKSHGLNYSQTYKRGYGLWKDNFDAMANKTVLKLLLSKFAPLSVDMQKAVITDQSVVNDFESIEVTYIDNLDESKEEVAEQKVSERLKFMIEDCDNFEELSKLKNFIKNEYDERLYSEKVKLLKKKEI